MVNGTPAGLIRVLGHVSAIVVIPILGGTVAGIILDRLLGTSPFLVLGGFAAGNLVAAAGTWLYIRAQRRHIQQDLMSSHRDE